MTSEALETARRIIARTPAHKRPALIAKCHAVVARPVCEANARYEALAILEVVGGASPA